jgi:hypothetical protein
MRFLLTLRAIFFVVLLPGTVAGHVPFSILRSEDRLRVPEWTLSSVGASLLAIAGAVDLLRCVWDFFGKGKGTLAPIDPPRALVVSGLYRFTRNPIDAAGLPVASRMCAHRASSRSARRNGEKFICHIQTESGKDELSRVMPARTPSRTWKAFSTSPRNAKTSATRTAGASPRCDDNARNAASASP